MKVQTSHPPDFFIGKTVHILGRAYEVERARRRKRGTVILKLKGVDDINEAELLRNLYLEMDVEELEPTGEWEFYVYQLVGLRVVDEVSGEIGKVVDMHEWGPYWTFEVESKNGKIFYIPFVEEYVKSVDLEGGTMVVSLPEGYIDQF